MRLIDFPMVAMSAWRRPVSRTVSPTVTLSGTKWILDGTPIERLALLQAPYSDAPRTRGRANWSSADLRTFLRRAFDANEQPMFHAVGDGAIAMALDALEATGGDHWRPLRPRIFTVSLSDLPNTTSVLTIMNGRIVHDDPAVIAANVQTKASIPAATRWVPCDPAHRAR